MQGQQTEIFTSGRKVSDKKTVFFPDIADKRTAARFIAAAVAYFAAAALLGGTVVAFGAIPLGIALLCSQKEKVPFIFAGVVTGAIAFGSTNSLLPLLLVYTLCFGGRIAVSYWLSSSTKDQRGVTFFSEPIGIRVMTATLGGITASLFSVISNSFLFYDLLSMLVMCGFATLGTLLFAGISISPPRDDIEFVGRGKSSPHDVEAYIKLVWRSLGYMSLAAALCFAGARISFLGFSAGLVLAAVLTYIAAIAPKKYGFVYGALTGLLCGAACGFVFAPLFAIIGLLCGAVKRVGEVTAICAALFCGITYSLYVGGFESFIYAAPNVVCGTVLFIPVAKLVLGHNLKPVKNGGTPTISAAAPKSAPSTAKQESGARAAFEEQLSERGENRLRAISAKLRSTSEEICDLSEDLRRPGKPEISFLCESVKGNKCSKCKNYDRCFISAKQTDDSKPSDNAHPLINLAVSALSSGHIERRDAPTELLARCTNAEGLIAEMNAASAALYDEYSRQGRDGRVGMFAKGFEASATAVERALKEAEEESRLDSELSSAAAEIAAKMGLKCDAVHVYGVRRRRVLLLGVDSHSVKESGEEIARIFSGVCRRRLAAPHITVTDGYAVAAMESRDMLSVEFIWEGQKKEGEGINGDTVSAFETSDKRFYAILSDGMGSGKDASRASSACCAYAKRILTGCPGIGSETVFSMISEFLRSGSPEHECAATSDLFELDKITGEAHFRKSGAAPSWAVRLGSNGPKIFKISARTMPLGVTPETDSEEISLLLRGGDIVVMASDGVGGDCALSASGTSPDGDEARLIPHIIEEELSKVSSPDAIDVRALTKRIAAATVDPSRSDDVTVGVIRIVEN